MRTSLSEKEEVMAEEKKPAPKQRKKQAVPKQEAPKPAAEKPAAVKKSKPKKKSICEHKVHKHLGKGEILEELVVNNRPSYRVKFENLTKTSVFKQEDIIKE